MRGGLCVLIAAACCIGCSHSPTSSARDLSSAPIERLLIFVRDWPDEYVEIDLTRSAGESTLIMYRPPQVASGGQPAQPRILLDSIGPKKEDPAEIVELMNTFDVWALADSNAAGAACSTKSGQWVCYPTFNDYSLVMQVIRGDVSRSQRYTRLDGVNATHAARKLGDFILAWKRDVEARAGTKPGT